MRRAIVLGGTGKQSLGREIAILMLKDGITPVLIGRSAHNIQYDPVLIGAEFITADLMDGDVAEKVIHRVNDVSSVTHLVVAGGGPHLRGNLTDHSLSERRQLWRSIVEGPSEIIAAFHGATKHAYHLVTMASTSAVQIRRDETVYATAQAARRSFSLNFHEELSSRVNSKNLIICPGGMKTGLWEQSACDTSQFMDPAVVAQIIWQKAQEQVAPFAEFIIKRKSDGNPELEEGLSQERISIFEGGRFR